MNATPALGAAESSALPSGWRWAQLGELGTYINGRAFKPDDWGTSGLPIIRIQNLNTPDAPSDRYEGLVDDGHLIADGDLLISWSASLDAYIWDGGPAALNQHIFKVVVNEDLVTRDYLFYAVKYAMTGIRKRVHGATMQHVTKPEFVATRIPLPPLPDQQRIAAALRGQLNAAARMRAAAEAQAIAGAQLAVAAHRTEFAGMPIHELPLAEHAIFLPARSTTTTGDALVPVATSGCLSPSAFNPSGVVTNRMWSSDLEAARLRQGEVLVARSNTAELVGQSAMYDGHPEEVYAADLTIRLWPRPEVDARYLAHSLTFVWSTGYWRERAVGASWTMKKLSRRLLGQVAIPVPSLEEQRLVVRRLDDRLRRSAAMNRSVTEQAAEIGRLPEALLRCAFLAPR